MVSEKETANIRRFVCSQLREETSLSTLTLGILKKRYLAQIRCDSLSSEARNFMKRVVQEELLKMQDDDGSGSELDTKKSQKKRKREKENDEKESEKEVESRAKKSRVNHSSSSSESEEKEDCKTGSEQSDDEEQSQSDDAEQEVEKSQPRTNGKRKWQINSDNSSDEEHTKSGKKSGDRPKEMMKMKENATKNRKTRCSKTSEGKKTSQSDEENDTDLDSKSERIDDNESSDDNDKEEKASVEKKNNGTDSDSPSLPSLDDEQDGGKENAQDEEEEGKKKMKKKKKAVNKNENAKDQKRDDRAVVRLKRYISLCGVRRNYKKLLDGCRSIHSMVAVLKKELEDLGVHGQPSIEKCKKVRMNREEAQEIADLDTNNIIITQGRPKRRQPWQQHQDPPSLVYQRSLNSGSDSDQEQNTCRKVSEWANLRGIVSDDESSD